MSTTRLVLHPLQEPELEYLAGEKIQYLTGEHRLDTVPGVWSPLPDGALGARLELGPDETVTIDGRPVRGRVDLVPFETVVFDDHRSADVLIDNQNGVLRSVILTADRTSPRIAAVAGVLATPRTRSGADPPVSCPTTIPTRPRRSCDCTTGTGSSTAAASAGSTSTSATGGGTASR